MPVAEFSGDRGWGYDGVDLFAPHHVYGGPDGLKRLVNACHARGVAVLLDVVYNHLGPSGNYLLRFGPYLTNRYATPGGDGITDGRGSDEVRRLFCDNTLMWLRDYHFDGVRLDSVRAIIDGPAIHFLEQLAGEVVILERELGRRFVVIAESSLNDPRIVKPPTIGGYGLHAQWSDDFHHALHTTVLVNARGITLTSAPSLTLPKPCARLGFTMDVTRDFAAEDKDARRSVYRDISSLAMRRPTTTVLVIERLAIAVASNERREA